MQSIEPKNIDSQNRLKFHFGHCWENNYQKCKIFPRKGFGSKKKLTFWGIPGCPRVGPAPLAGSVVRENPPPKPRKSSFRQPWGGGVLRVWGWEKASCWLDPSSPSSLSTANVVPYASIDALPSMPRRLPRNCSSGTQWCSGKCTCRTNLHLAHDGRSWVPKTAQNTAQMFRRPKRCMGEVGSEVHGLTAFSNSEQK